MFRARPVVNALDGIKGLRAPIASSRLMSNKTGGLAEHLIGMGSKNGNGLRRNAAVSAAASQKRLTRGIHPLLGPSTVAQHGQAITMRQIRSGIRGA